MFFELRTYRTKPGMLDQWAKVMDEKIIPFQISKGMVVVGSFIGEDEEDLYVWIRRFESDEQRDQLYRAVYEDSVWKNELKHLGDEMLDRKKGIDVKKILATPKSVVQ
ncbi:MAG: NIPSNAP family protein [Caldilineaceae bacterium]|nr:NIPSNAP family protein [Caldilineaceae bacterium]MCY4521912.1 NIPSNAP family protein [Caldilineaceae bacterium]